MNTGGMNGGRAWRYCRRDVALKGVGLTEADCLALGEHVEALARTGHQEDAMLLRTVLRHQQAFLQQLARHTAIECRIADLVAALQAGHLDSAAQLRAELQGLGAVIVEGANKAIDWTNPIFGAEAAVMDGPLTHALAAAVDGRIS